MAEYIEWDKLEWWILNESASLDTESDRECAVSRLKEDIPAADVQPVKHGKWDRYETCSICGASKFSFFYCTETGDWDGDWNYCPNCGAKMDGE